MILSSKRQVVLPAGLCRQLALAPGARVRVELAPDGDGILVRAATAGEKKPASVLFDRIARRGTTACHRGIAGAGGGTEAGQEDVIALDTNILARAIATEIDADAADHGAAEAGAGLVVVRAPALRAGNGDRGTRMGPAGRL